MERTPSNPNDNKAQQQPTASTGSKFNIKNYFFLCLSGWIWFVLSLAVTFGCAWLYLKKTPNVYTRTTSILIKQERRNNTENPLQELGIMQGTANVTNEMLSLNAYEVALKVVQRLNLDVNYWHKGMFHDEVVYGLSLPITLRFEELNDNEGASLHLVLKADSTVVLSELKRGGRVYDGIIVTKLGRRVTTKLGKIAILPSPYYRRGTTDEMDVRRMPVGSAANSVRGRISANLQDKMSTIIDIRYSDMSVARAEDVLNTLVSVYSENWVKDRNQVAVSTNDFIKERLDVIEQELGNVDQDISSYKSEHLVPDVQQMGSMAMSQANAAEQQSIAIDNQIYMIRYIRNYLSDGQHDDRLLPSNTGIGSSTIGRQIDEYNEVLLTRNNHLANSSLQNPLVIDLDQQLATMRISIIQSLDNELAILREQRRNISFTHSNAVSAIATNPKQAKYLLSVERQQKVKESLYLFLLQKREENELSQAFTAYNTRLIEPPHGSMTPSYPVPRSVYLYAFCFGMGLPAVFFFAKEVLSTSVRSRKDLANLQTPYVGDIPLVVNHEKSQTSTGKKDKKNKEVPEVVVMENSRNSINEAFRVIRTNLEFVMGFDTDHHIIMLTSLFPNAGKTFITANLATTLAIKGKRVIAVDLDLRKGSLSEYVNKPKHGISNYLSGQEADYHNLIAQLGKVDVMPCGTLPPNPTELLFVPKFQKMMEEMREQYDYVFIDCPPVEIVADASIINIHADMTLFVVRAMMTDLSVLPEIDRWYNEKRYKNLSVILNGTASGVGYYKYGRYGYGRYGYGRYGYGRYGYGRYGYGYGYGTYGYGEGDTKKKKSKV